MKYLLDADVLINAHRQYYAFGICPGFWDWLKQKHETKSIASIKAVYDDLLRSEDQLSIWAREMDAHGFFIENDDEATVDNIKKLSDWAANAQFTEGALDEFYDSSDLPLVAHAKAHDFVVATRETYDENIKKRVKIPNACKYIGVEYTDTFQLMREAGDAWFVLQKQQSVTI